MGMFISFMLGLWIGMFITALFQANRNIEDKERCEHAIKMATYYQNQRNEFAEELKQQMLESKYQQLNTEKAKDYNSFVDWWAGKIDELNKGGTEE